MDARLLFLCFTSVFAAHEWPWNPGHHELDLGAHATMTDVLGLHNHTLNILTDTEHNFMAIKDTYFHGCYLIDVAAAHMTTDDILAEIKTQRVAVLPGQFDVQYPPLVHADVQHKFGHRIGHFCLHNPTMWLVKHVVASHGEL